MRLFKILCYFIALDIGCTIAFCAHSKYDNSPNYVLVEDYQEQHIHQTSSTIIKWSEQAKKGKQLFRTNCAACHNKNMVDQMTGPALAGVEGRWEGRETLLYEWIRNSRAVMATGDSYAVELYRKWAPTEMNAFPNLEDEDIDAILAYIEEAST